MPFEYIDHEADVGILGIGSTLEEAFVEGAKAMADYMVGMESVDNKKQIEIRCEADNIPALFIEWLNEILANVDLSNMFFSGFEIEKIESSNNKFSLKGKAFGEEIDLDKHKVKTEVKAATYSGLKYEERDNKYYLRCVLDI